MTSVSRLTWVTRVTWDDYTWITRVTRVNESSVR